MNINFKKAFLSPFSDSKWKSKLLILILLSTFNILLGVISAKFNVFVLLLLNIPITFICAGYIAQFAHNEINQILPLLPSWHSSFLKYFKYGFSSYIVVLIYSIPIVITFLFIKSLTGKEYLNFLMTLFGNINVLNFFDKYIVNFLFSLPKMIFILLSCMTYASAFCLYWNNFKISDTFAIKKIFKFIIKAKYELIAMSLLAIGLTHVTIFLENLVIPFNIAIFVAYIILCSLQALIIANALAQIYYSNFSDELRRFLNGTR